MSQNSKTDQSFNPTSHRKHFTRKVLVPVGGGTPVSQKAAPKASAPKKPEIVLSKFEAAVFNELKSNIGVVSSMGDGSLPFLVGLLVSKFQLVFTNEEGFVRGRLLKSTILNLQDMNLLKVQHTSKFPLGPGRVSLV